MSAPDCSTPQSATERRPTGSFENGFFVPHHSVETSKRRASATSTIVSRERSATPEWYYDADGLDHLNPAGVRTGAAYAALETHGSNFSSWRDSVSGGNYEHAASRKRRRLSPVEYVKAGIRRLWPTPVGTPSHGLPMTCGHTQSETALDHYHPLEVEADTFSLVDYWVSMGYAPTLNAVRPARPRTVSLPSVVTNDSWASVRWLGHSTYMAGPLHAHQMNAPNPESEESSASEPVSPVTQVPMSPRLEGESKGDDLDSQMEALLI